MEPATPMPAPSWDGRSRAAAVTAAQEALRRFARPGLSPAQWQDGLRPVLSEAGRQWYQYVDPAQVPATQVRPGARLVDVSSPYLAGVDVPTDVGVYRVLLSRLEAAAPWKVERFTPPKGVR
ncbi:MAG TPA: hypothetical protein VES95_10855 [Dermatophilaceae bacterium]|nr:hypothetical protein [Dermatophilaceae bacterium]